MRQEMMGLGDTVASAGPYANNQHLAPESRQTITPTPHHSIFTGRMLFLTPNQQCQSTAEKKKQLLFMSIQFNSISTYTSASRQPECQICLEQVHVQSPMACGSTAAAGHQPYNN